MDPNLYAEQPGLTPDARHHEEGVDYLRRLKAHVEGEALAALTNAGPLPALTSYTGEERRRSPRFQCNGSVEFKPEGSDVRMWGTLTDVSLHGCYVEMSTTFPVGTNVDLVLESAGIRVQARGTVRVSYPFLGMGICLTSLEPGQQTQLEQLLAAVSGQNATPDLATTPAAAPDITTATDPASFLEEMRQFFARHQLLSREEYFRIAQRCQRT